MTDITTRLRESSTSYDEWRVQDPKDGAYCIAYSWPETIDPERKARAWLDNNKARFPDGLHSDYVVACVRVQSEKDSLMLEAAAEIDRLRSAVHSCHPACSMAGCVNDRLRAALRGMLDDDDHDAAKVAARAALGE